MSPLTLRRYRAERLLRQEFEGLRARVIASVRGRLRASGASLDASDLDACYAQAWQGLYAAILDGQEIANPTGWLTLVTYRRAIEELRAGRHVDHGAGRPTRGAHGPQPSAPARPEHAEEPDFAAELDDRIRLRQLFEGLRGRLSAREREAAAFCYLQGLSRSEAATRMGISEARMRKLMDGRGAGRPGVAGKVGALAETIRVGGWCEEQGSLMRALAYGMLDPGGERYRLALIHRSECPACRAYVVSLRGLAAVLPPVLLPWALGVEALARAGATAHAGSGLGGGAGAGTGAGAQTGAAAGGGAPGVGIGGALPASGAVGVGGAAGGGWLLAGGPLGAKLAVGCLLALGVGAGCVALTDGNGRPPDRHHGAHAARAARAGGSATPSLRADRLASVLPGERPVDAPARSGSVVALPATEQAIREFGPERGSAPGQQQSASPSVRATPTASSASDEGSPAGAHSAEGSAPGGSPSTAAGGSLARASGGRSAAAREFGIG
jgi:DNA-directed RNA polymerase specialized sigma24 family protein